MSGAFCPTATALRPSDRQNRNYRFAGGVSESMVATTTTTTTNHPPRARCRCCCWKENSRIPYILQKVTTMKTLWTGLWRRQLGKRTISPNTSPLPCTKPFPCKACRCGGAVRSRTFRKSISITSRLEILRRTAPLTTFVKPGRKRTRFFATGNRSRRLRKHDTTQHNTTRRNVMNVSKVNDVTNRSKRKHPIQNRGIRFKPRISVKWNAIVCLATTYTQALEFATNCKHSKISTFLRRCVARHTRRMIDIRLID
mmetsp:Transcript_9436/g.20420  ORF Transcript_9436/g.20420 Transcript_9436/m.20420 type:complete len:255 (-) Transcript_9436:1137-1901(-)